MQISLIAALVILVLLVFYVIGIYNSLVRGRNQCDEAWSDIETHLKRRCDLIPNLVETVKGYAKHESSTLEGVIAARNAAINQSGGPESHAAAENALGQSLKSIFALAEAYPDLKANQNFIELQREITDTEDKIQASRRFYNSISLTYNNRVDMFPGSIIAGTFSFIKRAYFELDEGERAAASKAPKIQF